MGTNNHGLRRKASLKVGEECRWGEKKKKGIEKADLLHARTRSGGGGALGKFTRKGEKRWGATN